MFKFLGPRSRINYWSCSKFADRIRGIKKPLALTFEEWEKWRIESKNKNPIRFYIAEEVLDKLQNLLNFPKDFYRFIENYIDNRFIEKTHCLKTGLKPGCYYELDYRILHGLFNELVDFVEKEQAQMHAASSQKKYKFKNGRCPQAGVDYLKWASNIKYNEEVGVSKKDKELYGKPTEQAKSALKIIELYNWWKDRQYRPDPMIESGWEDYIENQENKTNDEKVLAFEKLNSLEDKYEKEDENMMIELIKIRKHLWT